MAGRLLRRSFLAFIAYTRSRLPVSAFHLVHSTIFASLANPIRLANQPFERFVKFDTDLPVAQSATD